MDEPWYNSTFITYDYIYDDLVCSINQSNQWGNIVKLSQRLPYIIHDVGFLHSAIVKSIDSADIEACSIRGYTSSIRYPLIKCVIDKIIEYRKVKALMVLSNSHIISIWVNHVLYKPSSHRSSLLKKEFEELVSSN